jgi:very-short-patch-repair endonuclease
MSGDTASSFQPVTGSSKVHAYIEEWKSRLIDLSRRNKLLYFKHTAKGNLLVTSPDAETVFSKLVSRKRSLDFWMPPAEEPAPAGKKTVTPPLEFPIQPPKPTSSHLVCDGDLTRTDLENILKKFNRRALLDYRERGVRILYAAFGMLTWRDIATNEEVRSPLVMVPVELTRKSVLEPFTLSVPPVEESVIPNPALQVKLRTDFKFDMPPFPENGEASSLTDYFNAITQVVARFGWKVEPTLEIGLFSFHKLVIYKDLEANADAIAQHPIIRAIAGAKDAPLVMDSLPDEKDVDAIEAPERTFRVLDADSSQRISIDYALQGQSFVMQGPPGTGKSQTIANIISECIARGKSVLFVSDKMAALEVVYKRLRDVGLAPFCLELHSSKANKQEVVAELMRCLNEQLVPRNLPSAHDFDKLNALQNLLNGYVRALNVKQRNLQMSAFEVLCELTRLEAVPSVPVGLANVGDLTPQRLRELENLVAQLSGVWQAVEEKNFPWHGYRGNSYSLEVRSELTTFLEALISQVNLLHLESMEFSKRLGLDTPETFAQVDWLMELSRLLMESPKPEPNWLTHPDIYELTQEAQAHQELFEWRQAQRTRLLESYKESLFNLSLNKSAEIEQALTSIRTLLVPASIEDGDLLKKQEPLAKLLTSSRELTEKWAGYAKDLAQQLGLSWENLTTERVAHLSRLAVLCFSENKPEAAWFDPPTLRRVQEIVPKAKKDFQENNLLRSQIMKAYDDRICSLDLDEFIRRYNGPYRGFSRLFRPAYHRDQKQLALLTREGRVPKTVVKDLIDARRAKMLQAEIDGYAGTLQGLLGHFYEGANTDFQRVEKAVEATSEILRILGFSPVPESLAKLASHGASVPQPVRWLGVELQESVSNWRKIVEELSPIIPVSMLPNSKLPINDTPLTELAEWSDETGKQLSQLLALTGAVLQASKGEPVNYRQLLDDLRSAESVRKKEIEFINNRASLKAKFGNRFSEFDTDWKEILAVLEWTKKTQTLFGSHNMPDAFVSALSGGVENAPSNVVLVQRLKEAVASLSALESHFENEITYQGQKLHQATLEAALNKAVMLRDRVDDLRIWVDFKDIKDRFTLAGLAPFFTRLTEEPFPATQLGDIFRKGACQEWMNNLYLQDDRLGRFRRENQEQAIADFRKVDQDLIRRSAGRVVEAANVRKPQDILIQADDSEIGVLLKESAKKRRLMPIRSLLQRIPNLLPRLKPCLLMSPISVSQFLSPDVMKFDLILYDEASQIVPEDAVGSIYRGKTIVVAGDNKQLPPTSFFQKSLIEDVDWDEMTEGDVEVFDSILDECLGIGLPVKTLRWHYRSRHETLIAFSNERFYNGALVTFPAAQAENEALGVKLVHVADGVYDRGGRRDNPAEAEAVANLVFEHFKKYPEKTLGVVTFSIAQMETVEEAVERRIMEQPDFEHFFQEDRLEGFFVKNLENVQGDERDVIIFSVGYGRDQQGQVTMNFGPLNKAGGERRLNVAVTRAREKVILVTSIKASDITVTPASPAGVQALRGYIEYAEKTHEASQSAPQVSAFDSALEEAVGAEIQRMDYNIVPHVGSSAYPIDVGVVDPANPDCYLLGIECDGATYRASNSARDRDRLREQVLNQLGWRIHRVWSPDWVARRESEVRRLKDALDEACQLRTEIAAPQPIQRESQVEIEVKQVQFGGSERIGIPYKVHPLKAVFNPYVRIALSKYPYSTVEKNEFHFQENRILQSRLLEELVREEGPIHFDYAVQRLAATWDVRRIGPKVISATREALDMLLKDHRVTVKGDFLWPNDLVDVPVRVPVVGIPESLRQPEHVPPEEIESAMRLVAQYALSISSESLIAETARVFGFTHGTEKTRERLREVYNKMLRERKLVNNNDKIAVP